MDTSSETPDVIAQQVRYALSRLRSRNAHHLFEDLCRCFAAERISRNILPATGPVGAGGDQGRDFETFRSFITGHFLASFMAIENNRPIVFTCTLQTQDLAAKIRADVNKISERGEVETVYCFVESDIPIAKRHKLIDWSKAEHQIDLEVIDGTALAEQLSQSSLFWIVERFLDFPSSLRPSPITHLGIEIEELLSRPGTLRLPPWPKDWKEPHYSTFVSVTDSRFLLLDRVSLPILGSNGRYEACDLLGPDDELIHIKRCRPFSYSFESLISQALTSTEILAYSAEARTALTETVRKLGHGRLLRSDYRPREVVLAFPSEVGGVVPMQRIPPRARLGLTRAASAIKAHGTNLRILGIEEG